MTLSLLLLSLAPAPCAPLQGLEEPDRLDRARLAAAVFEATYAARERADGVRELDNPSQGLTAAFDPRGLDVRGIAGGLSMQLEAWGRGGSMRAAGEASLSSEGRRVELRRTGITEWYVNAMQGLEQGFDVDAAPPGEGPLVLQLALPGRTVEPSSDGRDALLRGGADDVVFHYTGLEVLDAKGRSLEARIAPGDERLTLVVEDAGARYPIAIDPWIWVEESRVSADDSAQFDYYGFSTAASGTTVLVGIPGKDTVVVLVESGGVWFEEARLSVPSAANDFGWSLDIQGDRALIGAHTINGTVQLGSAFVYERTGTSWAQVAELVSGDLVGGDQFGFAVALDGDTAVVSAPFTDSTAGPFRGAVYAFRLVGSAWVEEAKFSASAGELGEQFGVALDLEGDRVLAGSPYYNGTVLGGDVGAAYVFERSGSTWSEVAMLEASDQAFQDYFGSSVALAGADALIGATGDNHPGSGGGSVYVYTETAGVWNRTDKFWVSGASPFGGRIAADGDVALFGSRATPTNGLLFSGSAYLYERSGGTWTYQTTLIPADAEQGDEFGASVALSGGRAVIGAPERNNIYGENYGAAYVFDGAGASWTEVLRVDGVESAPGDHFGSSVAISGDAALVGTPESDLVGPDSGAAFVFRRNPLNFKWEREARLTAADPGSADRFGSAVAIEGDTALVGAEQRGGTGAAFVFTHSAGTWGESAVLSSSDAAVGDLFGGSVALAGGSALIGAPGDSSAGLGAGAAYVFDGAGTSWSEVTELTASDAGPGDAFGTSVSLSVDTALVGAPGGDAAAAEGGAAYAFVRAGGTWGEEAVLHAVGASPNERFGAAVAVDGDTALVGLPGDQAQGPGTGAAQVFVRSGGTWGLEAELTANGGAAGEHFGSAVALDGDVALVGAPDAGSGATFGFHRVAGLWNWQSQLAGSVADPGDGFGTAVALSGGFGAVGAPLSEGEGLDSGSAFLFREVAQIAISYCTAGTSASGCQALITSSGTPSASASSGFVLTAANMEGAKDGLYFYGVNGRQANPWGNGTSYVCVIPPRVRGGLLSGNGSTAGFCDGQLSQDLNARWCATCPKPQHNPGAGALVQAQLWYRDPQSTSNQTSSMSDAVEFVVEP